MSSSWGTSLEVLSLPPPYLWSLHLELMLGVTSVGLHLFSSLGLCLFILMGSWSLPGSQATRSGPNEGSSGTDIDQYLELGRNYLVIGQYAEALQQYHLAVEGDPRNYMTYFRRATVYLALGRSKAALKDLNKVVDLKPDFISARLQRGIVLLKQGELDEAHIDFEWTLRADPMNEEANRLYLLIEPLRYDLEMADVLYNDKNYVPAIEILTKILQECPWSGVLRERRADCFEGIGDLGSAISDLRPTVKQTPDNTMGLLKLSQMLYKYGEAEDSLNAIRDCLKLDPDHRRCFAHYKHVKKVAAALKAIQEMIGESQFAECAQKAQTTLELVKDAAQLRYTIRSKICHCLNKAGRSSEAILACSETLSEHDPDDVNILCDRADAYINMDQFEEASRDFHRAATIDEHSQRAHEGIKRVQKLEKQSKTRNYYHILGVERSASKKEIIKAYRKHASHWHPDNFKGDDKIKAEKKFIDIAAAKEVLTDPEKRQQFDNGEDPLDPESQAGQQFNPFAHGFQPFQNDGGPFTFKFHFS